MPVVSVLQTLFSSLSFTQLSGWHPCFCLIDEMLPTATQGKRLRQRGPMPKLADSEVITMELVGTYLGLSQDQEVFDYFRSCAWL